MKNVESGIIQFKFVVVFHLALLEKTVCKREEID